MSATEGVLRPSAHAAGGANTSPRGTIGVWGSWSWTARMWSALSLMVGGVIAPAQRRDSTPSLRRTHLPYDEVGTPARRKGPNGRARGHGRWPHHRSRPRFGRRRDRREVPRRHGRWRIGDGVVGRPRPLVQARAPRRDDTQPARTPRPPGQRAVADSPGTPGTAAYRANERSRPEVAHTTAACRTLCRGVSDRAISVAVSGLSGRVHD